MSILVQAQLVFAFVGVVLSLPWLVPYLSEQGTSIGGVPGLLIQLFPYLLLGVIIYTLSQTRTRSTAGVRR